MAIRIFLDQGHNPEQVNAGAEAFGLREQDVTYNVGVYLADLLSRDPNFDVRLSRNSPDEILGTSNTSSLAERVRQANEWPADYFISIHCNSNNNPAINGTEVYVYQQYTQAYYLGEYILNSIVDIVGTKDNQVRIRPSLYVLRRTTMPSLLVELAYISNYEDNIDHDFVSSGEMEVWFIDVGQGDSALIISPEGKTMLIDCGEYENIDAVTGFLDKKGIDTIDVVIVSHPHTDHMGGMATIFWDYEIRPGCKAGVRTERRNYKRTFLDLLSYSTLRTNFPI